MKSQYLISFFMAMIATSCMQPEQKKQHMVKVNDTLTYSYQTLKFRAADCEGKKDSSCTTTKIKYPLFSDQANLNDSVDHKLTNLLEIDDVIPTANLEAYSKSFIKGYETEKKRFPDWTGNYRLNIYARVLRQDSSLTTLEIGGYAFLSGARGFSSTCFINWNTASHKNLTLEDIFVNGYADQLNHIAEAIFRKQKKLSSTASLAKNYLFENNRFALNNNFSITQAGIRFIYNETEIQSFALGQTNLLIPYTKIKSLLLPHTVIDQYIK